MRAKPPSEEDSKNKPLVAKIAQWIILGFGVIVVGAIALSIIIEMNRPSQEQQDFERSMDEVERKMCELYPDREGC